MLLVAAFIASLIPAFFLYRWLKRQKDMPDGYADRCKKSLIGGIVCTFPVIGMSLVLHVTGNLLHFRDGNPVLYQAYYTFIAIAFSEELMKFLAMRRVIKGRSCSWLEVTVYMILVGLGFEVLEAVPYAIGSGAGHMLVRGITMMHVGFGFITGYFYGKSRYLGNKAIGVVGFVLAWLLHGLYDCTLAEEVLALSDWIAVIPVTLAAVCVVLLFLIIRFVKKAKNKEPCIAMR